MKYIKAPLTFADQADLLISRGLVADRQKLIRCLSKVNYYRLSAYWHPFRLPDSDYLEPSTSFEKVWAYYTFDRQFRLIVMDAIERVEVAIRTDMVNRFTLRHGAFGYLNPRNFSKIPEGTHALFIEHLREEKEKSRETFVIHFKAKYVEEPDLPFWMACELMSFGNFVRIFNYFPDRSIMAREYSINAEVLQSWLRSLNYVRNICAHHGRLWNRVLACSPKIPTDKLWAEPVRIMDSQNRIFSVLTILKYLLPYTAPQSKWSERLGKLLKAYPVIPKKLMGFPENWKECPIWKVPECHVPIFRAVRE